MENSSNAFSAETHDARHAAAIDDARRQFQQALLRTPVSPDGDLDAVRRPLPIASLIDSLPGYEIGPEIHRGGQGVVYKSVQRGTQREVAIKVMREGPFGGIREKARFEREIQILGQLKHPNIVTIHDSGASAHGFYFVMDYIDGETLDGYVASAKLDVRGTLRLFAKICQAVNVAHLRGVIHRDLKPANIRVDRAGEPHVLDFGLAKVDENDILADRASAARSVTGQFVGSLPWASPEQVDGGPGDLDVRTDVYALGVVLFQILTSQFPYEIAGNVRQVLDNICRAEPPKPSSIRTEIDDEVDAIVLKCLHKNKSERYQSAGDLARDLERYLAGETIEAKSDSGWYLVRKQLRKHRLAVGVIGLLAVVVTTGFVVSFAFWRQAVRDRDAARVAMVKADEARVEAERQEEVAESVVRFLTHDVLDKLDPYNTQGDDLTAKALFDQAAKDIEDGRFADKPRVEHEVRSMLGLVYIWMAEYSKAESQLRAALAIARRELGDEHERTLQSMRRLGSALSSQGRIAEAEPLVREAAEAQSRVLGEDHLEAIMARSALGTWYVDAGRAEDAAATYREVLDARRRVQGPEHPNTLAVMSNLAGVLMSMERYDEAGELLRQSLEGKRKVYRADHPELLMDLMLNAQLLVRMGKPQEAIEPASQALDGLIKAMGPSHTMTVTARLVLADAYEAVGRWDDATPILSAALDQQRKAGLGTSQSIELVLRLASNYSRQGELAKSESLLREVAAVHARVGGNATGRLQILAALINVLNELDKSAEAATFAEEAVGLTRETYGPESTPMAIALNNQSYSMMRSGKRDEAIALMREALAAQRAAKGDDDPLTLNLMHNLSIALGHPGSAEERESLLRGALDGRRRILGSDDPYTLRTIHALASLYREQNRLDAAEPLYREAVESAERVWPEGHYLTEHFRRGLAVCLMDQKRYAEAEAMLLLSYERDGRSLPKGHSNRIEGLEKLIELYNLWDKPQEAESWRAKLAEERGRDE